MKKKYLLFFSDLETEVQSSYVIVKASQKVRKTRFGTQLYTFPKPMFFSSHRSNQLPWSTWFIFINAA